MIISKITLKNWKNFSNLSFDLQDRVYVIGANAAGKSNLLDALCFLRDVAKPAGGGLQKAIADRGGMTKIRCLAARKDPEISIEVEFADSADSTEPLWRYKLSFRSEGKGKQRPVVTSEIANEFSASTNVLQRPGVEDKTDPERLTQTALEQINANFAFRVVAEFLASISYLHLVPQLMKYSDKIGGRRIDDDPYGQGFLEKLAKTTEKTRSARLRKIEKALQTAVPQLSDFTFLLDPISGKPHLEARYEHWRPNAGRQREDQFSDGTLRLLAIFWSLLDVGASRSTLLLEEPELSLNDSIVEKLPALIARLQRQAKYKRQVIITTHSSALLKDPGINPLGVLVLKPSNEGTTADQISEEDRIQLKAGFGIDEVLLPKTRPSIANQLSLL